MNAREASDAAWAASRGVRKDPLPPNPKHGQAPPPGGNANGRADKDGSPPKPPPPGRARGDTTSDQLIEKVFAPMRWTVPGYLPEGLAILAGRQKLGKTWLAMDFAAAVALGGLAMGSIQCSQGDVLYLDLENGERRIQRRLLELFPYPDVRPVLDRWLWRTHAPELGPKLIMELEEWCQSVARPALIVVDVLQRIKPTGSAARNAYENDYSALAELQQWATKSGVTVLVLHHTRKGGADDPLEALSGSNGLSACADTTLVLDKTASGTTLYVRGRDVEEKETALRFDAGHWSVLGEASDVHQSDSRRRILDLLRVAPEPMTPAEIADEIGLHRNTVKQALVRMTRDVAVSKMGKGRYAHPNPSYIPKPA
jgi:AAA domain/IclR helix-turn-helix domain